MSAAEATLEAWVAECERQVKAAKRHLKAARKAREYATETHHHYIASKETNA